MLKQHLQKIGLSENEATIYLAGLEIGPSSANQIAKKAELARTTTYSVLNSLIDKSIVSQFEKNNKKYFSMEQPKKLRNILSNQLEEAKSNLERFDSIHQFLEQKVNSQRPTVRMFEGKDVISSTFESIKESTSKQFYEIADSETFYQLVNENAVKDIKKHFQKNNLKCKGIYFGAERENVIDAKRIFLNKDNYPPFHTNLLIDDDTTTIMVLKDKVYSIVIEDKDVADTLKLLFNEAFSNLQKED